MRAFPGTGGTPGMDLRDYFAAHAMNTLIRTYGNHGDYEKCSEEAFAFADAMMKARKHERD